jgi:hypothetical protein
MQYFFQAVLNIFTRNVAFQMTQRFHYFPALEYCRVEKNVLNILSIQ